MSLEPGAPPRPARVVIIDDDEDFRCFAEVLLGQHDHFVVVGSAADGADGISLVNRLNPDVVLLDLQMPVLDGITALPLIRRRVPTARIVVVSAFPDLVTLVDLLAQGADLYLDKARAWEELIPALLASGPADSTTSAASTP